MLDMSPLELINSRRDDSASSDYVKMPYLKIGAGETKYVRFISAAVPTCVVRCGCGFTFDEPKSTLSSAKCPACGKPVTEDEVIFTRPAVEFARMHKWVEFASADGKRSGHTSFVCLEDSDNVALGLIPSPDGIRPEHRCPVCSSPANVYKRDDGTPYMRRASLRGIALAVERDVKVETTFDRVTGQRGTAVTDAKDVLCDDGTPNVVLVDMPKSTFWDFVCPGGDFSMSIGCLDWAITKIGSGTATKYSISPVGDYRAWDPSPLSDKMVDVHKMLLNLASPERYCKLGYQVAGMSQETPRNAADGPETDARRPADAHAPVDDDRPPYSDEDAFGYDDIEF